MDLVVHCCLCSAKAKRKIVLPDGWEHQYEGIDDEQSGFCPDHAAVKPFTDEQCVGCVGGWGDCDMWRAFAFLGRTSITDDDFKSLENGVCPRRTNGTIGVSNGVMEDINLSSRAVIAGQAFAKAIREYMGTYQ